MLGVALRRLTPRLYATSSMLRSSSSLPDPSQTATGRVTRADVNARLVDFKKNKDAFKLLKFVAERSMFFNGVNFSTAWISLGHMNERRYDKIKADKAFKEFLLKTTSKMMTNNREFYSVKQYSSIVHAVAKLGVPVEDCAVMLKAVEFRGNWIITQGAPQSVSDTAWAFAKLGFNSNDFFSIVEKEAERLVKAMQPQEVAKTVWAFAELGISAPTFFAAVEKRGPWIVGNGSPKEIADTAWAFARSRTFISPPMPFFAAVERVGEWMTNEGKGPDIAKTAWAFAELGLGGDVFFTAIQREGRRIIQDMKPSDAAITVWAFAELGIQAPNLFSTLQHKAPWLQQNGKPQDIANILWSIAALGVMAEEKELTTILWRRAMLMSDEFVDEGLVTQLYHVHLCAKIEGWDIDLKLDPIPQGLKDRMLDVIRDTWKNKLSENDEVTSLLVEMGVKCDQTSPFDGLDLMLGDDPSISLPTISGDEAMGRILPTIDTTSQHWLTFRESGTSKMKRRLLGKLGWRVIVIPYWEWQYMQVKTKHEKKQYLQSKLNNVVNNV
jgi:hypothetical protein